MRDRLVVFLGIVTVLLLLGAGVAVAAELGVFSSGSGTTTNASNGSAGTGGFGDGNGATGGGFGNAGDQGGGFGNGGGGRFGAGGGIFGSLGAAATYLGVSTSDLFTDLQSGKTLASVAKAQGKSVSGLVTAMVTAEKKSLASAVSSGQITQSQAQQLESSMQQRLTTLVNKGFSGFGRGGGGRFGGGGFGGPPGGGGLGGGAGGGLGGTGTTTTSATA